MKTLVLRDRVFSNQLFIDDFITANKNLLDNCIFIDTFGEVANIDELSGAGIIIYFSAQTSKNEISSVYKFFQNKNPKVLIVSESCSANLPSRFLNLSNVETINSKDFTADSLSIFFNYFLKANKASHSLNTNYNPGYNFSMEKIFENKGVGVTLADFSGKIIKCNKAFAKMLLYSEEEICKMRFTDFTYKEDINETTVLFSELVKGERDHYSIEKRYVRKDGKIIWSDLTVTGIKDNKHDYTLGISVNITGRKEAEEKLKIEKDLSLTLLNNIPDSIYFKNLKNNFIKVNKSVLKKFGLKKEADIIGKSDFDLFTKEHAQKAYEDEHKIIKTGKPLIGIEEKETWKNGKVTYASTTKLPLKNSAGKIIGTFGITRDITKQKEAELNLAKEKERAELIYRLIPSAIFTIDKKRNITSWNVRAEEITGYKSKEVIGKQCHIFSSNRCNTDCGLFNEKINKPLIGTKCTIITKDGKQLSISKNVDHLTDEHGNVIGGIESFEDVTERNQIEKIQKAQYQISEAVNSTPNITTLYKKIHDVVRGLMPAENFYIALFDEKTEILSFPYFVDEHDDAPTPRNLKKGLTEYVLRTGQDVLIDKKKDEELKAQGEVELLGEMQSIWLGVPLKIEDKVIGVMAVQDYTNDKVYGEKEKQILLFVSEQIASAIDKKRSHEELERYSEELKQLNITKDKFFSIIAHDLKNPFITLLGFSDMLVHDFDELTDEEKLTYITDIRNSAKLSHELLENLLDWSRSQTGKIEYEPHLFDIHELVRRNVLLLNPMAKTKNINLICDVYQNTEVFADYEMINTVIRNLISNAVKFTNTNGQIRIFTEENNNFLKLCVDDNGVGMNGKTLEKLFMLGEQYTTKGTARENGTGLGLILCKEFVEQNGGKIWAESEVGKGSRFNFTIPVNK